MPSWIVGTQVRRMRPETSMSAWIPALHARMTNPDFLKNLDELNTLNCLNVWNR